LPYLFARHRILRKNEDNTKYKADFLTIRGQLGLQIVTISLL